MSWVQVPPEAADFSLEKSLPRVSLNCVVFLCILEGVLKFVYHVYTWFGVWRLWWFNYPSLLLNTKSEFAC